MPATRRWLAAMLVALGLLPGLEGILLSHGHAGAGAATSFSATDDARPATGVTACAVCQARATLEALAFDAHPERHGAEPAAPPLASLGAEPTPTRPATPPARAPPLPIV